jgi:hypothetical protein
VTARWEWEWVSEVCPALVSLGERLVRGLGVFPGDYLHFRRTCVPGELEVLAGPCTPGAVDLGCVQLLRLHDVEFVRDSELGADKYVEALLSPFCVRSLPDEVLRDLSVKVGDYVWCVEDLPGHFVVLSERSHARRRLGVAEVAS